MAAVGFNARVADGAGANQRAGAQAAGARGVGNQLAQAPAHVGACVGHAHLAPVPAGLQGEVHAAVLPGVAQLVRRDGDGAERGGGLAGHGAPRLGGGRRGPLAQRGVVGQHQQAHGVQALLGRGAQGHIGHDGDQLAAKVDTPGLVGHLHVVARAAQVVAGALAQQRAGRFGQGGLHQLQVVGVGRAFDALARARQRRHALRRVKRERVARAAVVQRVVQVLQLRGDEVPVVQRLLQALRNAGGEVGGAQVA